MKPITVLLTISVLFMMTFFLGWPQFHYTAAIMIAVVLRYKDTPGDILARPTPAPSSRPSPKKVLS